MEDYGGRSYGTNALCLIKQRGPMTCEQLALLIEPNYKLGSFEHKQVRKAICVYFKKEINRGEPIKVMNPSETRGRRQQYIYRWVGGL